ncbi:methyltransferase domain-containing protein [bacterium]|nr:methyltransferase domain-containing protein [bacterium]
MAWYDDYFEDDYLLLEEPTDVETLGHIAFLRSVLPGRGAKVLDLASGSGRLTLALARLGYSVTGVDFKESMIRRSQEAIARAGLTAEFLCQDMRNLDFDSQFDFVLNFLHSFGYFRDQENLQVLSAIHRALKPGGRVLLDLANRDTLVREMDKHSRRWIYRGDQYVLFRRDLDPLTGRLESKIMVLPEGGHARHHVTSVRYYTYPEIKALLRQAGMRVAEVYGGYDRTPCSWGSPRTLVLAERTAG